MNNRVRLKVPEGYNDYINASPIELKSTKTGDVLKYIATQVRGEERTMIWILTEFTGPQVRHLPASLAHGLARDHLARRDRHADPDS